MLSVKIRYASGTEWTIEAEEVTYTPGRPPLPGEPTAGDIPAVVWVKRPLIDEIERVDNGSVWVMGTGGATVSTYHLGSPAPETPK